MKPRTFDIRPIKDKFGVFAGRKHKTLQVKTRTLTQASAWATAQESEDRITRLRHIVAYINARAERPPVVVEPSNQLELL